MKKQFLSAVLVGCIGFCTTLNSSVISEIRKEHPSLNRNEDVVIFSDKTQMSGKVERFPALTYTFGTIRLDPSELVAASFTPAGDRMKVKCITLNGEVFTGVTQEPLVMRDKDFEPKEIDPSIVAYLFLGNKEQDYSRKTVQGKAHQIQFTNGDSLPVLFNSEEIQLTDGYRQSSIRPSHIVDVSYNGGLFGTIKQGNETTSLPHSFVKSRHVDVYIPYAQTSLQLPWDNIDSITANSQLSAEEKRVLPEQLALKEPSVKVEAAPISENSITLQNLLQSLRQQESQAPKILTEGFLLQDPDQMVLIPEAIYLLSAPSAGAEAVSLSIVKVPGFYIDTHPVTNGEYKRFVEATSYSQPNHWVNGQIPAGKEDMPVTNVSYKDAQTYAQWIGKRLPTEIEWEAAVKKAANGSISLESINDGLLEWSSLLPEVAGDYKMVRQKMIFDRENNKAQLQRMPLKYDDSNGETTFRLVIDTK